ncbi:MAG: hypothetical protein VKN60_06225 [Cyanobacteriota bacterium]|nr:hypothetical protein [Cyanobacteriota bacterium]
MLSDIAQALKDQEYEKAAQLLQNLPPEKLNNPWAEFYQAQLLEGLGDPETAEALYRQQLTRAGNPKLVAQIRQALERRQGERQRREQAAAAQKAEAEQRQAQERQTALAEAKQQPGGDGLGLFVLDRVAPEEKQATALKLAPIFNLDPYSARLRLPSRSWRLYRAGPIGELNHYQSQCQDQGVPSFCVSLEQIQALAVIPVLHLETLTPLGQVSYRLNAQERDTLSFDWSEVSQRVEGLLPIFEECVHLDRKGKIERKTQILDYAKVCDLHLKKRRQILRFCDQTYEYDWGVSLLAAERRREQEGTSYEQWGRLLQIFRDHCLDTPLWSEFQPFAETALDFPELLKLIDPCLHFLRREETEWDQAFHLYSSLAFWRDR